MLFSQEQDCGLLKTVALPGDDAEGVYNALDYLKAIESDEKSATGKKSLLSAEETLRWTAKQQQSWQELKK